MKFKNLPKIQNLITFFSTNNLLNIEHYLYKPLSLNALSIYENESRLALNRCSHQFLKSQNDQNNNKKQNYKVKTQLDQPNNPNNQQDDDKGSGDNPKRSWWEFIQKWKMRSLWKCNISSVAD